MENISKLIRDLAARENKNAPQEQSEESYPKESYPKESYPEVVQKRPADTIAAKDRISLIRLQEAVVWSEILGEPLSKRRKSRKRR